MKKILVLIITLMFFVFAIDINADEEKILVDGSDSEYLTYYNSSEYVTIPKEFDYKEKEFRGVWVSTFVSDIPSYTSEEKFKADVTEMFNILEYYNYNALIFHIITHNNALYDSSLNPKASWWRSVDFAKFDPLKWLIDETHKRGMEFHAWMNPYRVQYGSTTYKAEGYPSANPASNPDNLLFEDGSTSKTTILNPAKEVVKSFLVQTCMEVVRKYDVDAIHFDDYFYVSGVDDEKDYQTNNPNGLSKADWRRTQIDDFIRRLSNQLKLYNNQNGKSVQLGISPSGGYKNGNGKVTYDENGTAITNGSLTNAGEHYGDYLYSDTKKWIDNEWIDYILPQCYHGMEQKYFASLIDWWDAVVKYKKVNLYIGIGLYGPGSYWNRHDELKNQFYFMNKHDNVDGFAIYKFSTLKSAYKKTNTLKASQVSPLYQLSWSKKCLPAVIERFSFGELDAVNNLKITKTGDGYNISFEKNDLARFYVLYKSENGELNTDNIACISSGTVKNGIVTISDKSDFDKEYQYTVVPLSRSNEVGKANTIKTSDVSYQVTFKTSDGKVLATKFTVDGKVEEPDFGDVENKTVKYSRSLENIYENIEIIVEFVDKVKVVAFEYMDTTGQWVREVKEFGIDAEIEFPTVPLVEGYTFKEFVLETDVYKAKYEKKKYLVEFLDINNDVIKTIEVEHGDEITDFPDGPTLDGHTFTKWDFEGKVTSSIQVKSIYEKNKYKVTFVNSLGEELEVKEYLYGDKLILIDGKEIDGYEFIGYSINGKTVEEEVNVFENMNVTLEYQEVKSGCKASAIQNLFYLISAFGICFVLRKKYF